MTNREHAFGRTPADAIVVAVHDGRRGMLVCRRSEGTRSWSGLTTSKLLHVSHTLDRCKARPVSASWVAKCEEDWPVSVVKVLGKVFSTSNSVFFCTSAIT